MAADQIHHLNCGSMCPIAGRYLIGDDPRIVCHVLLVEGSDGLTLIDTGFGTADVTKPPRSSAVFNVMMRPKLELGETAISQVQALGFDPADVRNIIVTHLDIDHAGGLPDFPAAKVHLWTREYDAMQRPPLRERVRYAVGAPHWAHGPEWVTHDVGGDQWLGFESVRLLPDSDPEILMIPLPGHTLGHTGIAVRRPDGWLLHCGDAYFYRDEVSTPPSSPRGLRAFQVIVEANGKIRRQNQERLRELAQRHAGEVELICAHDPMLLDRAQSLGPAIETSPEL
ncbi:MAG TPA: MBL fold metallo-hydrolase [Solirubrobacteraceae bacterium]|nr:MBL fold metallo-hydrolase [Solirubrobacteraceae bacterium]